MKLNIDWKGLAKALVKAVECTAESGAFGGNPRKERSN